MGWSKNTIKKAVIIAELVSKHYEAGNQSKSISNVFTTIIKPIYPISERTFWRYIGYAQQNLGFDFTSDGLYLESIFEKMLPETKAKVRNIANMVVKTGSKNRTRKEMFELCEKELDINYNMFSLYLNIAEIYLSYKFSFEEYTRIKENRNSRKLAFEN